MEIGTGLFLGLSVIGVVILYIATRDRWKWRKNMLRVLLGLIAICTLIWLSFWAYNSYVQRVVPKRDYMGLSLTDTLADVKFKKGLSQHKDESSWLYLDRENKFETQIILRNSKVRAILYIGECTYCNSIFDLNIGDSYQKVVDKIGAPSHVSTSLDQLRRMASFEKTNLLFMFAEGRVTRMGVYDSTSGPLEFDRDKERAEEAEFRERMKKDELISK